MIFLTLRKGRGFKCSFLFSTQPNLPIHLIQHPLPLLAVRHHFNTALAQLVS
ncbi:hypothetical protein EVA_06141 [gut metagenome]|uniref:Uncharacterized protein n=1 Tax=gut metagenome TaxID=749906 RepID=J9CZN1_9ZZZZ